MQLLSDFSIWFKVIGSLSVGIGSILLAWRVKAILQWVVYCLVAHEQSIEQLVKFASNQQQTKLIVSGVTKHLLDIESKLGMVLLVTGFLFLGIGMFSNMAAILVGAGM